MMKSNDIWYEDISFNCSRLIPQYYKESKHDSIHLLLDYWLKKTYEFIIENRLWDGSDIRLYEPIVRFEILYAISGDSLSEQKNLPEFLIENKKIYDKYFHWTWSTSYRSITFNHYIDKKWISNEFNNFTFQLAQNLMCDMSDSLSVEYLLCKIYSKDFGYFYKNIKHHKLRDSFLQKSCKEHLQRTVNSYYYHASIFTGYWIPLGNKKILGKHPQIGMSLGFTKKRIISELIIAIGFQNTKKSYTFNHENGIRSTRKFQNNFFGLDMGYELIRKNHFSYNVFGGIAWDALIISPEDNNPNQEGHTMSAINLNSAIGIKYFYGRFCTRYFEFQLRYNYVNYNTNGGSDLSGNIVSLRFAFNLYDNESQSYIRKAYNHSY